MHKRSVLIHFACWFVWWTVLSLPYFFDVYKGPAQLWMSLYNIAALTIIFYSTTFFYRNSLFILITTLIAMSAAEMLLNWRLGRLFYSEAEMRQAWPTDAKYISKRLAVQALYIATGIMYCWFRESLLLKQRLHEAEIACKEAELELQAQSLELYRQLLETEQANSRMILKVNKSLKTQYLKEVKELRAMIDDVD